MEEYGGGERAGDRCGAPRTGKEEKHDEGGQGAGGRGKGLHVEGRGEWQVARWSNNLNILQFVHSRRPPIHQLITDGSHPCR